MKILLNRLLLISLSSLLISGIVFAADKTDKKKPKKSNEKLVIKAIPWGPAQAEVDAAQARVAKSEAVQNVLGGAKARIVGFEYIDNSTADKSQPTKVPTHFRVIFYDYSNDRAVIAENDFAGREAINVRTELYDPGVGGEELEAAYRLVKADPEFSGLSKNNQLEYDAAMPPVSNLDGERLVNVTVKNLTTDSYQIVGISFKNNKVVRYEDNAPPTARVEPDACGIASAGQGSTGAGVAGQYQLTVSSLTRGTLWEMLVIRPSSSSGASSERSGIEIRDVKYKGVSVLKRGHAPILNVQYINNTCGPFRDWQYAEGYFNAPDTGAVYPNGVNGGIAVLAAGQIATTSVETRNDSGNFRGVAIYQQDVGNGPEVVMVSEMNAGWYRYIMEWRFAPDGTIRPRYGFGSTTNGCVCNPRNHHVYWRFDFDVVSPTNNIFEVQKGRNPLALITTEAARLRHTQAGFMIQSVSGKEAYQITPGSNDGTVTNAQGILTDTFGAGDFWLMQFKGTAGAPSELDDPNSGSAANLAPWVNGESLSSQDVVVWYSAHQYRVDDASRAGGKAEGANIINGRHVVGPDISVVNW